MKNGWRYRIGISSRFLSENRKHPVSGSVLVFSCQDAYYIHS